MVELTPISPGAHVIQRVGRAINHEFDRPLPKFVRQTWEQLTPQATEAMLLRAVAAVHALRYEDGTDEDLAIAVGRRLRLDPVMVIECFDGMLDAILGPLATVREGLGDPSEAPQRMLEIAPESEYGRNGESE